MLGLIALTVTSMIVAGFMLLRTRKLEAALELAERERSQHAADRELLRVLIDQSPLAIVLCTDAGRIVLDNAAARRLFFEQRSAEGQNFVRLVANGPQA